jgi:general secretion pathway protein L
MVCAYSLRGKAGLIEAQGVAPLADLVSLIRSVQELLVILPAADVTLLRLAVPPLSAAKLRLALPNLVEDKLLGELADCLVAAAPASGGLRSVAVAQRAWLTAMVQILRDLGAQRVKVVPEQLCLDWQAGTVSVALSEAETAITLALRHAEQEGMGMVLNSADELLATLRNLVPAAPVRLFVPPAAWARYQNLLASDKQIEVIAAHVSHWQAAGVSPDLAIGLGGSAQAQWHWQAWRWPLALGVALLLINVVALNFDWWRMSREAANLRASMKQIYLSAYPKETVILDPLLQMRQKITAAKHDSGSAAADDFSRLVAEFSQAWDSTHPADSSAIVSLTYQQRSLLVQLKSPLPAPAMQAALAAHQLNLEVAPDAATTWTIRSQK